MEITVVRIYHSGAIALLNKQDMMKQGFHELHDTTNIF